MGGVGVIIMEMLHLVILRVLRTKKYALTEWLMRKSMWVDK